MQNMFLFALPISANIDQGKLKFSYKDRKSSIITLKTVSKSSFILLTGYTVSS